MQETGLEQRPKAKAPTLPRGPAAQLGQKVSAQWPGAAGGRPWSGGGKGAKRPRTTAPSPPPALRAHRGRTLPLAGPGGAGL